MAIFYANGEQQVKKTLVVLKMMKKLLQFGYDFDRVFEYALNFEEELISFYKKSKATELCCVSLGLISELYSPEFVGGEILELNSDFAPISRFMKDKTFDLNRIDEIIKLFDSLVKLSIIEVYISGEASYEEIKQCFWPAPFSSSAPNFANDIVDHENCRESLAIYKTFSNAKINYEFEVDNKPLGEGHHFSGEFAVEPQWVIEGKVLYSKQGEIYLGMSSPHTQFDFASTSFYIDSTLFPTREDLYSPNEALSLKNYKNQDRF